jgi:hypothetical protein
MLNHFSAKNMGNAHLMVVDHIGKVIGRVKI